MAVHLSWPLHFVDGSLATVEQDSLEEVAQNVALLWSIPRGFFIHDPDLGVDSPLFSELPIDPADLAASAAEFEDRAVVEFDENEEADQLAAQGEARIPVRISLAEEG